MQDRGEKCPCMTFKSFIFILSDIISHEEWHFSPNISTNANLMHSSLKNKLILMYLHFRHNSSCFFSISTTKIVPNKATAKLFWVSGEHTTVCYWINQPFECNIWMNDSMTHSCSDLSPPTDDFSFMFKGVIWHDFKFSLFLECYKLFVHI